jgi:hypothetical protein
MPRKPNYSFARSQREQAKAAKKQAKEDAKLASAQGNTDTETAPDSEVVADIVGEPRRP